jgi:tetratricopeptide (TPR) repeat protein
MSPAPNQIVLLAVHPGLLLAVLAVVLLVALALWQLLGSGPRRGRALRNAQSLLEQDQWQQALDTVRRLQGESGLSPAWQDKLQAFEGDCLGVAGNEALRERRYDDALRFLREAAPLTGTAESAVARVAEAMLAETRAHFATGPAGNPAVYALVARVLALQPDAPEPLFWQGLCLAREGRIDQAIAVLENVHRVANRQFIDPPFYLGVLLYRQGKAQESLRMLAEANRVDANCPFVAWQMGQAMVAAGNDAGMALRVLQRALGPRGLPLWLAMPHRAWVEAFPQGRSFVRRLAEAHAYTCPLLGSDLRVLIRIAEQAVAQAHYRMGNFQESADLYGKLLGEAPPTLSLVRGLGLALMRLGKYDQAYKHLRAATDMEPQHALTAAYLALCAARGRPQQPEDKPKNVAWAVRQLARFDVRGDVEYAAVASAIHGEARALNLAIAREDQVRVCDLLASVQAHDAEAAGAYDRLARDFPDALAPVYAWLYCRAAVEHDFKGERDAELFALAFRDRTTAQTYFNGQNWDLDEAEFVYLDRSAVNRPGRFPEDLGADYPKRGEAFLLERSQRLEEAGNLPGALQNVAVLLRLAPRCLAAYDRAAALNYRQKNTETALQILHNWHQIEPGNPLPLVRRAVIEQHGDPAGSLLTIERALGLAKGTARASIAWLGARLVLASVTLPGIPSRNGTAPRADAPDLGVAQRFLLECLRGQPDHTDALWTLAAIRTVLGDQDGLAELSPRLDRPEVKDARFQYLGAVAHLAAGNYQKAQQAARRVSDAACREEQVRREESSTSGRTDGTSGQAGHPTRYTADSALVIESQYVLAWALFHLGDEAGAARVLEPVAASKGPSAEHARALLGKLKFRHGSYGDAARWWTALDATKRGAWKFDEPLRHTVLLAGLLALEGGQYEEAAERFREAGRLGLRDRRLGSLIGLSLFKAGQRLVYNDG